MGSIIIGILIIHVTFFEEKDGAKFVLLTRRKLKEALTYIS